MQNWQRSVNRLATGAEGLLEPAIPIDEGKRLVSLRRLNILDSAPEERFDRITRLAQSMFNVPIALVSLVDSNRQWFKSCQGLGATETPRNISFCGHAIHDDVALVIPDALQDARFADNPLVVNAPFIRFYAGQPLKMLDGSRVGTLCIIDTVPHQLSQTELTSLRDLGRIVESELGTLDILDAATVIKNSESRLHAIIDNVRDGIITINAEGLIESFNHGAQLIFGYEDNEVIGRNLDMLIAESSRSQYGLHSESRPAAGQKNGTGRYREVAGVRKNREEFSMEVSMTEMMLGGRQMFTAIVRDISERVKIQNMKNEFTAVVSHELRTPLTSIRGALGLIMGSMQSELSPQLSTLLDIADRNSNRLLLLVNDILDSEKIEAGSVNLNMRPLDLLPLIQQVVDSTVAYGQQFDVMFRIIPPESSAVVEADADRLTQVLVNLLSNAAKFSPQGDEVAVTLQCLGDGVRISVSDKGPGIAEDFRARIFQKFTQADSSVTRSKGGTGLGLSISKALIEMMDGNIGFDSQPGKGATFFVELPLSRTA